MVWVFWLSVLINLSLVAYLCSPYCKPELRHTINVFSSAFARSNRHLSGV